MTKKVECIRNGLMQFTKGKIYIVVAKGKYGYTIIDNRGKDVFADKVYFKEIEEEKGNVMTKKVKCIVDHYNSLTKDKVYVVKDSYDDFYSIVDDFNYEIDFLKINFVEVKEEFTNVYPKTLSEKIAVMQAFEGGSKIEVGLFGEDWVDSSNPDWNWNSFDYRIKEAEKPVEDVIDWSHVKDEYICHAFDEDGKGNFYTVTPTADHRFLWWDSTEDYTSSSAFKSVKRGTTSWDKSLVFRPTLT